MTLPKIAQLEFPEQPVQKSTTTTVHKTLAWDFEVGDFKLSDGKTIVVSGIEYIKIWIQKALRTVKNSRIYVGTQYGSEHHSLIGRNFKPAFSQAEYERMIREALLQNNAILRVERFVFSTNESRLSIQFDVTSIYSTTTEQVVI